MLNRQNSIFVSSTLILQRRNNEHNKGKEKKKINQFAQQNHFRFQYWINIVIDFYQTAILDVCRNSS